jgi:hypothetical protein
MSKPTLQTDEMRAGWPDAPAEMHAQKRKRRTRAEMAAASDAVADPVAQMRALRVALEEEEQRLETRLGVVRTALGRS